MTKINEYVVLVDEEDVPVGVHDKRTVHSIKTPLHRAFSLFLFNRKNQLLLQQRSRLKKTWPLVWSNSCCGHPKPGESYENAVKRRTFFELGVELETVRKVSDYRYCFSKEGVVENEICPIFIGFHKGSVRPNPIEIETIYWINWEDWLKEVRHSSEKYSPWCVEETQIIHSIGFRFLPS